LVSRHGRSLFQSKPPVPANARPCDKLPHRRPRTRSGCAIVFVESGRDILWRILPESA
jgi:hypothetical protein